MTGTKRPVSLYELIRISNQIQETLISSQGELTPELDKQLVELEENMIAKIDGYQLVIDRAMRESEYWLEKSKEYKLISDRIAAYVKHLNENLAMAIKNYGTDHLEGQDWVARLIEASPKTIIENQDLIPGKYKEVVQETLIKKTLIKDDIKAGVDVPGAHLEPSFYIRFTPNRRVK